MQNGEETKQRVVVLPEQPKKKRYKGFLIFLGLLAALGLFALLMIMQRETSDDPYEIEDEPYVAVMYIEGEIGDSNYDSLGYPYGYQHDWTLDQLDQLAYDSYNRGILFYVDSPGGTIYHSDELYLAIREYRETTGRPVYVYMGPYGTSGAYYASVSADRIFANRNTWTGSIGVTIGTMFDFSQLLENYGIQHHTIDSGEMKSVGNMWDELTEEQEAYLQGLVDESYEQFVAIVTEERHMTVEEVKKLADGRMYTARQAKELGLIDEIGTMEDAMKEMRREYGLWDCDFTDVYYEFDYEPSVWDFLHMLTGKTDASSSQAQARVQSRSQTKTEYPLKYLCDITE